MPPSGLSWPLPEALSDRELERRLFPPPPAVPADTRVVPDWAVVHQELRRPGVTLMLLWEEYRAAHPEGFGYSWFCKRYEDWSGSLDVVMRQTHRAGEKLFVDYAGQTVEVVDPASGEIRTAQIFVAVLGASNYTYAEATWSQGLADWIGSHVRAFAYFDGVPAILVPDNLRSGVSKAHRYEPDLNPTYLELANHYGVAVVPARVRKPRDKAKAETGVQIVERWILAALRHQTFFSLSALNTAIAALLERLNQRPFKKLPGSRRTAFETIDRPALRPLPLTPYVYATWKRVRVNIDYHVEVDGHYYSVPYTLVKQALDVRLTEHTVIPRPPVDPLKHSPGRRAVPQRRHGGATRPCRRPHKLQTMKNDASSWPSARAAAPRFTGRPESVESEDAQDPSEVVAVNQKGQFKPDLLQAASQEVVPAHPALEGAEGVLAERRSRAHRLGVLGHAHAMAFDQHRPAASGRSAGRGLLGRAQLRSGPPSQHPALAA